MLFCIRVHRAELCERSSPPGRQRRTARWKFEAVAQIVRLLDTIKAPGSPEHLSRPSDEGKVVEPTVRKHGKKNEPGSATASRSGASAKWETTERGL
jgi:hypothetical protein